MKFLLHTQYYPPEMGAPQARIADLAMRLAGAGHAVTVLTAMPSYPTGSVFEGYPRFFMREETEGVRVVRSWAVPSNSPRLLPRLVSYLTFAASSLGSGILAGGPADIVITESPPLFLAVCGLILARLKGARWIMNVSDLWPDSAAAVGMMRERSFPYRILARLARFLYRKAWLVTGQSEEIVAEIRSQEPAARTHHLSNGVDTRDFGPRMRDEGIRERYLRPGELGFVYAGLHGLFQGLDQVLDAAAALGDDLRVRFLFFGDGPVKDRLVGRARREGLDNVEFVPPLPQGEMPGVLASMDVAVVTLGSAVRGAVPSKIYEAMASGLPVVLVAGGEAARIVEETGAGIAVKPGDVKGLVLAAEKMCGAPGVRKSLGRAGRRAAERHYDRKTIVEEFMRRIGAGRDPEGAGGGRARGEVQ